MLWNRLTQVLCVTSGADKRLNYKNAITHWIDCTSPLCCHASSDSWGVLNVHYWTKGKLKMTYSVAQLIWVLPAESLHMKQWHAWEDAVTLMHTVNKEGLCQFFPLGSAIKIGAQWEASNDELSTFLSCSCDKVNRFCCRFIQHELMLISKHLITTVEWWCETMQEVLAFCRKTCVCGTFLLLFFEQQLQSRCSSPWQAEAFWDVL